jgi:hypothetical protein
MSTRTRIAKFGCLPVAVLLGAAIALGSTGDDDKPTGKTSPTKTTAPADHATLDDAASLACEDFARGYKAAQTQQARIDLADKVNKWAQQSTTDGIADNATALARGSEASAGAWQIGADSFAQACLDAGWKS